MRVRGRWWSIAVVLLAVVGIMAGYSGAQGPTKVRYALGDVVGIDEGPEVPPGSLYALAPFSLVVLVSEE